MFFCFSLQAQTFNIVLGRPTDSSVTANILFDTPVQMYFEYGTNSGTYNATTSQITTTSGEPVEVKMAGLLAETRYCYRVRYKKPADATFKQSDEYRFITQRKRGSTFTFTMESDPHPYDKKCHQPLWDICLKNQQADKPDFMFDLGDTFGNDHIATTITTEQVKQLMLNLRPVFGQICHSVPFFFCQGNHEGESGYYLLQTPPNNIATYETLWRKMYYPNPTPDTFYSGNNDVESFGMEKPENYYAFEWGDALFVVLDAYRYYTTSAKPRGWDWTFGETQYKWFKNVLENSKAKYKLVFTHHILGETRGAVAVAGQFEWGDSANYAAKRPGWDLPIHQLMVKNKVDIFVQGHDHLFALEKLNGLIYQTLPMPSDSSYMIGVTDNGSAFTGTILKGSGHLRFTVSPDSIQVDFVNALLPKDETSTYKNGDILYSYSVKKNMINGVETVSYNNVPDISVYPNPSNGNIRIKKKGEKLIRTVSVTGVDGRNFCTILINEKQNADESILLNLNSSAKLMDGIYCILITFDDHSSVRKLISINQP